MNEIQKDIIGFLVCFIFIAAAETSLARKQCQDWKCFCPVVAQPSDCQKPGAYGLCITMCESQNRRCTTGCYDCCAGCQIYCSGARAPSICECCNDADCPPQKPFCNPDGGQFSSDDCNCECGKVNGKDSCESALGLCWYCDGGECVKKADGTLIKKVCKKCQDGNLVDLCNECQDCTNGKCKKKVCPPSPVSPVEPPDDPCCP